MTNNIKKLKLEPVKPRSFWLRFFSSRSAARSSVISEAVTATGTEAGPASDGISAKKILVVDDDAVIRKTTSMKLKAHGFAVVTAADGPTAISAVRKEKPDLILLDISLPENDGAMEWDGLLIISWLRRLEEARHIPIVVITGSDPMEYKNRSLAAGAVAFFHKPIDHTDLVSAIDRLVHQNAVSPRPDCAATFQI